LQIYPIVSSSNGNCTLIESGESSILIDFGMSVRALIECLGIDIYGVEKFNKELERRVENLDDPEDIKAINSTRASLVKILNITPLGKEKVENLDAVLITHEHADHIRGLKTFGKRFNHIPVFINDMSYQHRENKMDTIQHKNLYAGMELTIGDFSIKAFTVKHDTKSCFGFVIDDSVIRLGYLTDTGRITRLIERELEDINSLFIESDYDTEKLANFEYYDDILKERIGGDTGHLSNQQALDLIETIGPEKLDTIIFGHLSLKTNTPEMVLEGAYERFPDHSDKFMVAPLEERKSLN